MTPAHYRCWIYPAHRVHNAAILAMLRCRCTKRTHAKREPQQKALFQ